MFGGSAKRPNKTPTKEAKMGIIRIDFSGSFDRRIVGKSLSASEHGHLHAVRQAIAYLKHDAIPIALEQDAKLRSEGYEPAKGFTVKDVRWLDLYGKRTGDQVPGMEEIMRMVGADIDGAMPPGWVFVLLAFSAGEGGAMTYLSSGERADMVAAVEEWITKVKAGNFGTVGQPIEVADTETAVDTDDLK